MRRSPNINLKLAAALLPLISSLTINAQKLPTVQQKSLRAPANITIDGKTTEWDNEFQAYNRATEIYYTVANDDDNLYLTIQATTPAIINKIIGGGVTFTIQKSGKKNDKDAISIIYPIFDPKNRPYINKGNAPTKLSGEFVDGKMVLTGDKSGKEPEIKTPKQLDSAMNINNKRITTGSKYIGIKGMKDLDSLISVYNTDGVKAAELFNANLAYTYELSINLKKLGLSVNDAAKFAYHITLNGAPPTILTFKVTGAAPGGSAGGPIGGPVGDAVRSGDLTAAAPTDFWGEYTILKK